MRKSITRTEADERAAAQAQEEHEVVVRLTPDLYRELDPEAAEECARVAVRYRDRGVVGLGIGPHAGEAAGPESVREVLSLLIRTGSGTASGRSKTRGCLPSWPDAA